MDPIVAISRTDYESITALKSELDKVCYLIIFVAVSLIVFSLIILLCVRKLTKTNLVVNDNLLKYNENIEKIIDTKYHQLA